jgi:hypothetical protein
MSLTTRVTVLAALSLAAIGATAVDAAAQPRPEAPPARTIGPGVDDKGEIWDEDEREKITKAVQQLHRNRCYVLIETWKTVPDGAGDVDITDGAAVQRALDKRRSQLIEKMDNHDNDIAHVIVLSKTKPYSRWTWWVYFAKDQVDDICKQFDELVGTKGMSAALAYLHEVMERRGQQQEADRRAAAEKQGAGDNPEEKFRAAAKQGGLTPSEVNLMVLRRGPASLEDLTDFLNGQVKDGRRALDLRSDLQTFVRALKERLVTAGAAKASASYVWVSDTADALNDGLEPSSSGDQSIARFTWWDHRGTKEWVQYDFKNAQKMSAVEVYWFDDNGGCRLPQSWRLLYKDGNNWRPVANSSAYGIAKDRFNRVTFTPVETRALRLEVQLQDNASGGILEWKVE